MCEQSRECQKISNVHVCVQRTMDDQNVQQEDSNAEGMAKGKSAKGILKGKTKAKKRTGQRAVLSESRDLTDTEGSIQTRKHKRSESETDSLSDTEEPKAK